MIFMLGGTSDSLKIGQALKKQNKPFVVSVVSDYGEVLAKQLDCPVLKKRMTPEDMRAYFCENNIELLLDATHPFAEEVSKNAMAVCQELDLQYLRFERPPLELPTTIAVTSIQEACEKAAEIGGPIYLTTGSKSLAQYVAALPIEQLIARVLPVGSVLLELEALGFQVHQIEALKGPFTTEMNLALIQRNGASVMISKESGTTGGLVEKAVACEQAGIPCIVIQRKRMTYPKQVSRIEDVLTALEKG